jgi:glycosyltransferase involved in cell wall biosynthesis
VFRANDVRDLADKLIYMYNNPAALKDMGFNGKAAALDKYAWRNEAKKLVKFYAGLSKESQDQEASN